jgi:hypothetical protein
MKHEGSLPSAQELITGTVRNLFESGPYLASYFFKIRFNIILPPTPRCPKLCLPLKFSDPNLVFVSPSFCTCSSSGVVRVDNIHLPEKSGKIRSITQSRTWAVLNGLNH